MVRKVGLVVGAGFRRAGSTLMFEDKSVDGIGRANPFHTAVHHPV